MRYVRNARQRRRSPHRGSKTHVNDVVRRIEGVKKVKSSHAKGRTEVVAEDSVNTALIKEAIAKQGYGVGRIETQPYEKHGLFSLKR